jgi:2-succinyl-5-enolpyruvyl-6-hydroxy-3-cyclohexene-1-carboxylate synthase
MTQAAWAELLVASLLGAGVDDVVISPGSRSTPLALALAAASARVHVVVDERSAGFFALGLARAHGAPVALVCTSGTAPAHYLPALIEASLTAAPLVVLSANRPPELHGAGASQTIDQAHLFGRFVRAFDDLGPPDGSPLALRALRRKIVQAVVRARGPWPGPVHVDVPLRKPLEPAPPATAAERAAVTTARELARAVPRAARATVRVPDDAIEAAAAAIAGARRGLIVATAGPAAWAAHRAAAFALARRTGFPLAVEAGSQLRFAVRPDDIAVIDRLGLITAAAAGEPAVALAPELVVQLGGEPVAMAWAGFAARRPPQRIVVADHGWPDGDSTAGQLLIGDVGDTLARLAARLAGPADPIGEPGFARAWQVADRAAAAAMSAALANAADGDPGALPPEGAVIAAAVAALPAGAQLVLGNSLPVRTIDEVTAGGRELTVLTQRGAAGIDGLIAGAAGAAATGRPTLLVLGDVSFAHDAGSLACARGLPLAIVVVDNGGGRIFDELPLASTLAPADLDRLWRTPPGLDPAAIARAYGLDAVRAARADAVAAAIATALAAGRPVLVHAPVAVDGARAVRAAALARLAGPEPALAACRPTAAAVTTHQGARP